MIYKIKAGLQAIIVFSIIIIAIALSFKFVHKNEEVKNVGSKENSLLVDVVKIQPQTLSIDITKTGSVEARNEISIVPEVTGRVVAVSENFRAGAHFKANEILFKIESLDYQLNVEQAKANLKQAETALLIAQAESDSAKAEWQALHDQKKIPPLVAKLPQLEQARANLTSAQALLQDAELDLKRTEYSLPYNGVVTMANVEIGQYLRASAEYGSVYTNQALEVVVPVEKELLKLISIGSPAQIVYRNQQEFSASVLRIGSNLDPNTRFAKIYLKPEQKHLSKLIPGTFVKVNMQGPEEANLWKIPNTTIQDAEHVWLVKEDQSISKYKPEILSINKNYSIVRGTGQEVILVSSMMIGANEGMSIRYE